MILEIYASIQYSNVRHNIVSNSSPNSNATPKLIPLREVPRLLTYVVPVVRETVLRIQTKFLFIRKDHTAPLSTRMAVMFWPLDNFSFMFGGQTATGPDFYTSGVEHYVAFVEFDVLCSTIVGITYLPSYRSTLQCCSSYSVIMSLGYVWLRDSTISFASKLLRRK